MTPDENGTTELTDCAEAVRRWRIWQQNCKHEQYYVATRVQDGCLTRDLFCGHCGAIAHSTPVQANDIPSWQYKEHKRKEEVRKDD